MQVFSNKTVTRKRQFVLGGSMVVPALFVAAAAISFFVCMVLCAIEPPTFPTSMLIEQIFGTDTIVIGEKTVKSAEKTQTTVLSQTIPADDAYLDSICYLGDSITYGMQYYGFTDPSTTFGKIGLNQDAARYTQFVDLGKSRLLTMAEAVAEIQPKRIILLMGVNGVSWMDESTFMALYEELVDQIQAASPNAILILESILPVTSYYETYVDPRLNNERIDAYNLKIQQLAEQQGCYFLNTAEVFKATDGSADINYMNGDGMHINKNGYQLMLRYIQSHAVES